MTMLAGIYSRNRGDAIADVVCEEIRRSLSRYPNEKTDEFRDERCFMVKADIGAYGEPALRIDDAGACFLAGEPLLSRTDSQPASRTRDVAEMHEAFSHGDLNVLQNTRGIFCVAHYNAEAGSLTIATDKLGLRPMYYWLGERYVVFSSALRVLEQLALVPKTMDVRGVTEIYALEYALADRTPFAAVKLLKSGGALEVNGAMSRLQQYWRWDDIAASDRPMEELTRDSYDKFAEAVALRNGGDTSTAAFLSGGLDSRSIVMALVQQGLHVHTFNFSIAGSQDQAFGAEFAHLVGTTHTERPRRHREQVSAMMAETWKASVAADPGVAERPAIVWSGNGGSVSLGHIYLTRTMVDLARSGDLDAALRLYRQACASEVPQRLLRSEVRDALPRIAHEGLVQEMADLHSPDVGRALYLFLMLNDQRRHTAEHFEEIDLNRLEYHLPFFDSDFVASVLRVPIDACLEHGFYMQWLRLFPEVVLSVPWQAYPGHEPCPLPIRTDLVSQWEAAEIGRVREAKRRDLLRQARQMLRASDFPEALLKKRSLRMAALIYRLGIRDVGHIIGAAHVYYRYWAKCGGSYLPTATVSVGPATAQ